MTRYPILFGYRDLVAGNGFVAGVQVNGRALIEEDDDCVWMIGINPGGFAAKGSTQRLAATAFREEYSTVLYDIASSAPSFSAFQGMLSEFLDDVQPVLLQTWQEAVQAVRQGRVTSKDLVKRDSSDFRPEIQAVLLETGNAKVDAEAEPQAKVTPESKPSRRASAAMPEVRQAEPTDNRVEMPALLAA